MSAQQEKEEGKNKLSPARRVLLEAYEDNDVAAIEWFGHLDILGMQPDKYREFQKAKNIKSFLIFLIILEFSVIISLLWRIGELIS